jgi:hypothetical protein
MTDPVDRAPVCDRAGRGAVADRPHAGHVRRAEHGPEGPLVLTATQQGSTVTLEVWGPPVTPTDVQHAALDRAHGWIGARDDGDLTAVARPHRPLHHAARRIGPVRLSVIPRTQEALGRAVLGALVQRVEAERSATQMAERIGVPAGGGLWCWPTADAIARTPGHALRRCGIGQRATVALHRGALDDARLERARDDMVQLDRRLRTLPGVGVWTSAEARRLRGDPDAVPLGDDGLPTLVCHALTGAVGDDCTDEAMLDALAPFTGQRGRVIRLIMLAVSAGLLPRHPRRGPRAALSAHRY